MSPDRGNKQCIQYTFVIILTTDTSLLTTKKRLLSCERSNVYNVSISTTDAFKLHTKTVYRQWKYALYVSISQDKDFKRHKLFFFFVFSDFSLDER